MVSFHCANDPFSSPANQTNILLFGMLNVVADVLIAAVLCSLLYGRRSHNERSAYVPLAKDLEFP